VHPTILHMRLQRFERGEFGSQEAGKIRGRCRRGVGRAWWRRQDVWNTLKIGKTVDDTQGVTWI